MPAPNEHRREAGTARHVRRVGEYTILRRLGGGAMGEVFEAIQESLQRKVALKILKPELAQDGETIERFLREAQSLARLHHPHIVPVYGSGRAPDGTCYYAMEFVKGRPLLDFIQDKKQPLRDYRRIAKWTLQTAEALDYAHKNGVIHRDVKPANIMVNEEDKAVITDFGLARLQASRSITQDGALMGTPTYMAPEQALGEEIDARIDVYALGVCLYECLAGRLPFETNDLRDLLIMITQSQPSAPRRWNKEAPFELDAIAMKAMEKRKEKRYQSARELADDLIRFMRGEVVQAAPLPLAVVLRKKIEKNKIAAALAGALLVVVVLAVTAVAFSGGRGSRKRAAEFVEEAKQLEKSRRPGSLKEARDKVAAALALVPDDDAIRTRLEQIDARLAEREENRKEEDRQSVRKNERDQLAQRSARELQEGLSSITKPLASWKQAADQFEAVLRAGRGGEEFRSKLASLLAEEDVLARAADTSLKRLEAAAALAPDGDDPSGKQARETAGAVLRALLKRAQRRGERALASTYARDLRRIDPKDAPDAAARVRFDCSTPKARARVSPVIESGAPPRLVEDSPVLMDGADFPKEIKLPPARSFVLELSAPGYVTARIPFVVEEDERVDLGRIALPDARSVPDGFVYVAGGAFPAGGDPEAVRPRSAARELAWVDPFFIARTEVTLGEYLAFVNDLSPEERSAHLPSPALVVVRTDAGMKYEPATTFGEPAKLPACGVSYESALAYCQWRTRRGGGKVRFRLPASDEWEKAARGADARAFPWGDAFDPSAARASVSDGFAPTPVGASAGDISPYGVFDLAGSVSEWTSDLLAGRWRIVRGGSWARGPEPVRLASREPIDAAAFSVLRDRIGFRLAFDAPDSR